MDYSTGAGAAQWAISTENAPENPQPFLLTERIFGETGKGGRSPKNSGGKEDSGKSENAGN